MCIYIYLIYYIYIWYTIDTSTINPIINSLNSSNWAILTCDTSERISRSSQRNLDSVGHTMSYIKNPHYILIFPVKYIHFFWWYIIKSFHFQWLVTHIIYQWEPQLYPLIPYCIRQKISIAIPIKSTKFQWIQHLPR